MLPTLEDLAIDNIGRGRKHAGFEQLLLYRFELLVPLPCREFRESLCLEQFAYHRDVFNRTRFIPRQPENPAQVIDNIFALIPREQKADTCKGGVKTAPSPTNADTKARTIALKFPERPLVPCDLPPCLVYSKRVHLLRLWLLCGESRKAAEKGQPGNIDSASRNHAQGWFQRHITAKVTNINSDDQTIAQQSAHGAGRVS